MALGDGWSARGGAVVAVVGVAGALVATLLVRAGRHLGAGPDEVAAVLPGDALDAAATVATTRAIEIAAAPHEVWPWLVQMGYRRGGWYAIDVLERLIGAGDFLTGGSADRIVPELQDLAVGDRIALSERAHLVVAHLDAPRALVLVLPGGPLAWVWSFTLHGDTSTRLVVRCRTGARAGWVRPLLPLLEAGHLVMELVQLHRLRARVEAASAPARM